MLKFNSIHTILFGFYVLALMLSGLLYAGEIDHYEFDVSLDDLTRKELSGRVKINIDYDIYGPQSGKVYEWETEDEERNIVHHNRRYDINGNPTFRYSSRVTKNDSVVFDQTKEWKYYAVPVPKDESKFFEASLGPNINGVSALKLKDDAGNSFFLTAEFYRAIRFEMKKNSDGSFETRKPAQPGNMLIRVTVVPDKPFAKHYLWMDDTLPNFRSQEDVACAAAGESRNLLPLQIYNSQIARTEYCYPTRSGFERIVLGTSGQVKPDRFDEGLAKLKAAGAKQVKPGFKIKDLMTMNCHGYTIRATTDELKLALPENASWIEGSLPGSIHVGTAGTYPLLVILEENYDLITQHDVGWGMVEYSTKLDTGMNSPEVKDGDIVVLQNSSGLIHSGIIVTVKGKKLIQSKFETGNIYNASIEALSKLYPPTKVSFYRAKHPRTK